MSRKKDLINMLREYKNRYEAVQVKVTDINGSQEYTEVGRQQAVNRSLEEFASTVQLYHDKVTGVLNEGLDALAEKWKKSSTGKLFDSGYQAGLANVIKMLEFGAVSEEDIQNIIEMYMGDYNALAVIKKILLKSENENLKACAPLIPTDTRENNRRLLKQFGTNVDNFLNIYAVENAVKTWERSNQGMTSLSLGLDGMIQFVSDRLDDDLELLN